MFFPHNVPQNIYIKVKKSNKIREEKKTLVPIFGNFFTGYQVSFYSW